MVWYVKVAFNNYKTNIAVIHSFVYHCHQVQRFVDQWTQTLERFQLGKPIHASRSCSCTYRGDVSAGSDAVAGAHPHQPLVVGVLAPSHQDLLADEVGLLVDHEEAALHPAGVAPAQVGGQLRAVTAGLVGAALEVPLLVEYDLRKATETGCNKHGLCLVFHVDTSVLFTYPPHGHDLCELISGVQHPHQPFSLFIRGTAVVFPHGLC